MSRLPTDVHCMIDLETLGLSQDCAVFEIGAVFFTQDRIIERFQTFVKPEGEITPSTVLWHIGRPARDIPHDSPSYCDALLALSTFIRHNGVEYFWSHGINFDLAILQRAYFRYSLVPPWTYKQLRDTRTLAWVTNSKPTVQDTAHEALADAVAQAEWVMSVLRKL